MSQEHLLNKTYKNQRVCAYVNIHKIYYIFIEIWYKQYMPGALRVNDAVQEEKQQKR